MQWRCIPHAQPQEEAAKYCAVGSADALSGQQLADKLAGQLTIVGRHVEMGDCSDHDWTESGNLDSTLCRRGGKTRLGPN